MQNNHTDRLSDAQLEIMEVVWDRGEASIAEVLASVNGRRKKKLRRTTIQVQMNRLEKKGWLTHRVEGRTYRYEALRPREEALAAIADDVTHRVFGGSCADLVKCLHDHKKINASEIRRLRKLLDELNGNNGRKGGGRS